MTKLDELDAAWKEANTTADELYRSAQTALGVERVRAKMAYAKAELKTLAIEQQITHYLIDEETIPEMREEVAHG